MTIKCDMNGDTVNDYESTVTAIDHDPGGKKLGAMQDTTSSLGFVPMEGYVISIFTAIENNELWPNLDDSSPEAARPLAPTDSRLAGGYPDRFETPRGYDFSYFGDGFKRGAKPKKNLVDCVVTDLGLLEGREATESGTESGCLRDGVLQDDCFENIWVADYPEALTDSAPCLAFGDPEYDQCMAPDVTYLYQDDFYIKARVTGDSGAKAKLVNKDKKERKHKNGGHKGKKRGR
jgi:hypothetical protein